jgi:hypothetical protein
MTLGPEYKHKPLTEKKTYLNYTSSVTPLLECLSRCSLLDEAEIWLVSSLD